MEDENKTKKQLIEEIKYLREQGLSFQQFVHPPDKQVEMENVHDKLLGGETLFNAIGSAIWMLDDQHIIKRSNKAAEEIFHLPVSAMIGKPCWEIVHKTSHPIPQCPVVRASQTKKRESLELPTGQQWFEIVVDVVSDASGRVIGYIHILSDITARKKRCRHAKSSCGPSWRHLHRAHFSWIKMAVCS